VEDKREEGREGIGSREGRESRKERRRQEKSR
jgi:hypothetical protein